MAGRRGKALVVGSRGSALARWQTEWVVARLQAAWPGLTCRIEYFTTSGDRDTDRPLPEMGGKGVFTDDLARALENRKIDFAVHSLKDLPVDETPNLTVAAICERADARDVLVAAMPCTLASLPAGARVGTSSLRRSAQLLAKRPDLVVLPIRGNVDTRIRKAMNGEYDAVLLAAAGLERLGLGQHIVEMIPLDMILPAPGQGALAVQCRANDEAARDCLAAIDHLPTRRAVSAERAFLKALGGGCSAPIAAYAHGTNGGVLKICGLVVARNGQQAVHVFNKGDDPHKLGAALAQEAFNRGAGVLLQ
jgi:hydroxymethylbilane synthase